MWPYALVFAFLAVDAITSGRMRSQSEKPHGLIISTIVVALFVGLRVQVGGDWYVYLRIFNHCAAIDLWSALNFKVTDPAYGFLNWSAGQLGAGIWAVNLVCAAIFAFGLRSFCRLQTNPPLALLVAFPYVIVVVAMGYTRQSVALGLLMAAIVQYQQRRILRVVVLMIAAAAFHKSAVVVAPLFAIAETEGKFKTFVMVMFMAALSYFVFLQHSLNDLIDNYINAKYNSNGTLIRILMNLAPCGTFFLYRRRIPFRPREYRLWFVFSIAVLLSALAYVYSPSSTAVDRVALYLLPVQITILSRLPDVYREQHDMRLTLIAAVIMYSFVVGATWLLFGSTSWAWLPYQNYLWLPTDFVPNYHPR